ncbi:MAG: hypothetical protein WCK21_05280, partial [Actinomycetota bacterium]
IVVGGPQADGDFWATATGANVAGTVDFALVQAFFGPACTAALSADQCDGDMGVKAQPTVTVTVSATALMSISVVATTRQNYAVPGKELVALLMGNPPMAAAPAGFVVQTYPFLITIEGGVVTAAHQIWMP